MHLRSSLCATLYVLCFTPQRYVNGWDLLSRGSFLSTIMTTSVIEAISAIDDDDHHNRNEMARPTRTTTTASAMDNAFRYSEDWEGTRLNLMSLKQSVSLDAINAGSGSWSMGRWPDPALRHQAKQVDERWFGTPELEQASSFLRKTSRQEHAVGLAAQQCGVDARIIHLELASILPFQRRYITMVNPVIVKRSSEIEMRTWNEFCLVLPPDFRATVLRDASILVNYRDAKGTPHSKRLHGEEARAAQHEMDHDRGILITDHVSLEELPTKMQEIERIGHAERMAVAYARSY